MRRLSMATRKELKSALARRYRISSRVEKGRILDEFVAVTGYHRKHAMRLVRSDPDGSHSGAAQSLADLPRRRERCADTALGSRRPGVRQAFEGPAADPD